MIMLVDSNILLLTPDSSRLRSLNFTNNKQGFTQILQLQTFSHNLLIMKIAAKATSIASVYIQKYMKASEQV